MPGFLARYSAKFEPPSIICGSASCMIYWCLCVGRKDGVGERLGVEGEGEGEAGIRIAIAV